MTSAHKGITALTPLKTLDLPNVYIADKPCVFRLPIGNEWFQVACHPWLTGKSLKVIKKLDDGCRLYPDMTTVFLGHLTLDQATLSGSETSIGEYASDAHTVGCLAYPDAPWNYVALGHIHKRQAFESNGITIAYSVSVDCLNQGERMDLKGGYLLTLEDNRLKTILPVASSIREFFNFTINKLDDLKKVTEEINGGIVQLGYKHTISYAWVKRTLDKFQPYHLKVWEIPPKKERKRKLPEGISVESMTETQMLKLYLDNTMPNSPERLEILKAGTKLIRENP